jgi:hypothetical protein
MARDFEELDMVSFAQAFLLCTHLSPEVATRGNNLEQVQSPQHHALLWRLLRSRPAICTLPCVPLLQKRQRQTISSDECHCQ